MNVTNLENFQRICQFVGREGQAVRYGRIGVFEQRAKIVDNLDKKE